MTLFSRSTVYMSMAQHSTRQLFTRADQYERIRTIERKLSRVVGEGEHFVLAPPREAGGNGKAILVLRSSCTGARDDGKVGLSELRVPAFARSTTPNPQLLRIIFAIEVNSCV